MAITGIRPPMPPAATGGGTSPLQWLNGVSGVLSGLGGIPGISSSARSGSDSGDINNNLLWQSPFLVGDNARADTNGSLDSNAGGSGGQVGPISGDTITVLIVVMLAAAVVTVAIARGGK